MTTRGRGRRPSTISAVLTTKRERAHIHRRPDAPRSGPRRRPVRPKQTGCPDFNPSVRQASIGEQRIVDPIGSLVTALASPVHARKPHATTLSGAMDTTGHPFHQHFCRRPTTSPIRDGAKHSGNSSTAGLDLNTSRAPTAGQRHQSTGKTKQLATTSRSDALSDACRDRGCRRGVIA